VAPPAGLPLTQTLLRPGLGPVVHRAQMFPFAIPVTAAAPPPVTGSTLPTMGVG
jgi:hypothetical protein